MTSFVNEDKSMLSSLEISTYLSTLRTPWSLPHIHMTGWHQRNNSATVFSNLTLKTLFFTYQCILLYKCIKECEPCSIAYHGHSCVVIFLRQAFAE